MIRSFYLNKAVYWIAGICSALFIISFFIPPLFVAARVIIVLTILTILIDTVLLYVRKNGLKAERIVPERFSNGDNNKVTLRFRNSFPFQLAIKVIDELPVQFQERKWVRELMIEPMSEEKLEYVVRPLTRGEYIFNSINAYASSPLRLVSRRFTFDQEQLVKVYPSYIQLKRFQLLAVSNRLQEVGVKRIRRIGHSMEFEQIKDYVRGDDYRTINWKATARKGDFMVNNYTDERSQQIYCLINKGRVMKMPFDGMYLLDHAINAALILCNVAMSRQDKAGIITFGEQVDAYITADKKPTQINLILETLYNQKTRFLEADFEKLFSVIRNRINHRSLLVMFTNFESIESLQREMPSLQRIARYHLLLVVIFENTELKKLQEEKIKTTEDIYIRTIADKFAYEKRLMVKEMQKNGILSILTTPENLTVNAINKYLEIKTRSSI